MRSCAANKRRACAGGTGTVLDSDIVPLTRGSTTTLAPDKVARVRATASISAFTKLSVTGSRREDLRAGGFVIGLAAGLSAFWACTCGMSQPMAARQAKAKALRGQRARFKGRM